MDNPLIFDYKLIEQFRKRAFKKSGQSADFLLQYVCSELSERLQTVDRKFQLAADIHGHTGQGAQTLLNSNKVDTVDIVETSEDYINGSYKFIKRHRELLDLPDQYYDLVTSLLSLHITNDVPGVLLQIKKSLKPDGLFLGVMAGAGTLGELRESLLQAEMEIYGGVSPRVYPFADIRDAGALLQRAGFAMPVTDVEDLTVRYNTAFDLMYDLRAMGMQNALIGRSRKTLSKRFFNRVAEIYSERFSDPDGRIRARFSFVWLSGWAPDKNQQKPMKPGTGKISLADVLGDKSGQ